MFFKKKKPAKQEQLSEMTEEEARNLVGQIPGFAEKQREIAKAVFGHDLNYSAESIPLIDEIIKEGWPKEPPVMLDDMVLAFGSYLGEAIRHVHGGDWCFSQEHGLHFDVGGLGLKIFPFTKVRKRFLNGEEDSIGFFYSFIRSKVEEAQKSK